MQEKLENRIILFFTDVCVIANHANTSTEGPPLSRFCDSEKLGCSKIRMGLVWGIGDV